MGKKKKKRHKTNLDNPLNENSVIFLSYFPMTLSRKRDVFAAFLLDLMMCNDSWRSFKSAINNLRLGLKEVFLALCQWYFPNSARNLTESSKKPKLMSSLWSLAIRSLLHWVRKFWEALFFCWLPCCSLEIRFIIWSTPLSMLYTCMLD